jgi:hypothetical protein
VRYTGFRGLDSLLRSNRKSTGYGDFHSSPFSLRAKPRGEDVIFAERCSESRRLGTYKYRMYHFLQGFGNQGKQLCLNKRSEIEKDPADYLYQKSLRFPSLLRV